jgi:glucose-1-phosphate thymidylyltransferase
VAGKPLIHYAVDDLIDAGIRDIGIVVSHDTIDHLKETLEGYRGAAYTYVLQDPPKGLAHAVAVARPFLGTTRSSCTWATTCSSGASSPSSTRSGPTRA